MPSTASPITSTTTLYVHAVQALAPLTGRRYRTQAPCGRLCWQGVAIASLLQFVLAPRINAFFSDILINSGIAIILAVSLTVVNGFTGQFSIGHAGFMSLGGYLAVAIVYYGLVFHFFGDADFHGGRLCYTGGDVFDGTFLGRGRCGCFIGACNWPARFSPPSSGGLLACPRCACAAIIWPSSRSALARLFASSSRDRRISSTRHRPIRPSAMCLFTNNSRILAAPSASAARRLTPPSSGFGRQPS